MYINIISYAADSELIDEKTVTQTPKVRHVLDHTI